MCRCSDFGAHPQILKYELILCNGASPFSLSFEGCIKQTRARFLNTWKHFSKIDCTNVGESAWARTLKKHTLISNCSDFVSTLVLTLALTHSRPMSKTRNNCYRWRWFRYGLAHAVPLHIIIFEKCMFPGPRPNLKNLQLISTIITCIALICTQNLYIYIIHPSVNIRASKDTRASALLWVTFIHVLYI